MLFSRELLLLYGLAGIGMIGGSLFRPILPIFTRAFGATGFEIGLLTSGFMIARAFVSIGSGKLIDLGYSSRKLIRIGFGLVVILTFFFLSVKSYLGILLIRVGQGICSGMIWPSAQIMVGGFSERGYRTRALSIYQITGRIGMLLSRGILIGILMIGTRLGYSAHERYRLVFLFAAILLMGGFLESWFLKGKEKEMEPKDAGGFHFDPILPIAFIMGGLLSLQSIAILYFNEQFSIRPVDIVAILLIMDLVILVTTYLFSFIADRYGVKPALLFIIIPCVVAGLGFPFQRIASLSLLFWFLTRVTVTGFIPIARSYATAQKSGVGMSIGFLNMATNLGAVVGPALGGIIYDQLWGGFKIASYSILSLLLPIFFFWLRRE
ncbi:hypothetical protein DRP53_03870 [candidate division WOR-3 bacterium]|uniref:Major facilitator superfamily (MFS) profile domain-containing protein n=1 Tax=candidate division WOR-3 bacterium TaxID=2052148 RepID=A0A660SIX3_UNCW3|nr:MAG: hypothetical protein DRP53_03870 [candidate division WOR-3 bacterium]